jgi:hypothetical protein
VEEDDGYDSDAFIAPAPESRPKNHRGLASMQSMATHAAAGRRYSKPVVADLEYRAGLLDHVPC